MHTDDALSQIRQDAKNAYRDGRAAAVIELLAPFLRQKPDDAYAWQMYGDALRIVGRNRESEVALLRALELAPPEKRAYVTSRLARQYDQWGRHADAEDYYGKVATDDEWKDLGWLWIMRGANLARLGDFDRAEDCHRRATALQDGDRDEAWLNLGPVLRAHGKYDEATEALTKCLELDSSCEMAQEALKSMEGIRAVIDSVQIIDSQQ